MKNSFTGFRSHELPVDCNSCLYAYEYDAENVKVENEFFIHKIDNEFYVFALKRFSLIVAEMNPIHWRSLIFGPSNNGTPANMLIQLHDGSRR